MLQNNLQYTLAKITQFNINNDKKEQNKWRKRTRKIDASKFQAKNTQLDSNGSIFGNDINAIDLPNDVMLIKTTVKDLRVVQ